MNLLVADNDYKLQHEVALEIKWWDQIRTHIKLNYPIHRSVCSINCNFCF